MGKGFAGCAKNFFLQKRGHFLAFNVFLVKFYEEKPEKT